MINPINHGKTSAAITTYKVEPYVLAADVYALAPHTGRGGWTWYTGSAGWLYRLIIESFLGLQQADNRLTFVPCIPEEWESVKIHYRYKNTLYHIVILQNKSSEKTTVDLDGVQQEENAITLTDDRSEHQVLLILAKTPSIQYTNKHLLTLSS
jgi:cellobiose phosphorylase